jgi:uncharacterized membrane protein
MGAFIQMTLFLFVIGAVILVLSGLLDVAHSIAVGVDESAFEEAAKNTTTPGTYYGPPLVTLPVVVVLALLVGGYLTALRESEENDGGVSKDRITLLKEDYVDGDIRSTLKLEQELEQEVEPFLDDSDVQELDDMLDNGDDTE